MQAETTVDTNITAQRISLWITAVAGVVFLVVFLTFPGFLPPMSPNMTPDQLAHFFRIHAASIRFSMVVVDLCGVMLLPFFALIVVQMKRMATPSHVFAYCYLSAVVSGATLFAIPDLLWLVATFRPDRDPALIQLLNDMAWMIFTAPVGMLVAQNVCLGLAIYMDKQERPVFPRWVGHFNMVTAVLIAPAAVAATVRTGPFAWNGAISFWLKIVTYAVFVAVMFFMLRRAVNQQAAEQSVAA
jgi:hypothetical protein